MSECDEDSDRMKGSAFKQEHPIGERRERRLQLERAPASARSSSASWVDDLLYLSCLPAEKRQAEAARIREKYPDRIPVRLEEPLAAEVRQHGVSHISCFNDFPRHAVCPLRSSSRRQSAQTYQTSTRRSERVNGHPGPCLESSEIVVRWPLCESSRAGADTLPVEGTWCRRTSLRVSSST